MNKVLRITEFAKQLFGTDQIGLKAGEIIEGILTARSPMISDIADALKGKYEANYKKIQRFLDQTDPKEQLHMLFN